MDEAARDHEFLLHAARELRRQRFPLIGELEFIEQCVEAGAVVSGLIQARNELQVLLDREIVEQPRLIGHEREAALRGDRIEPQIDAANPDLAIGGRMHTCQRAKGGGLARAIRTNEPKDVTLFDVE